MPAELTYAGLVARPDRATLLATLDGAAEPARAALLPALHRAGQRLVDLIERNGADVARRTESSALVRAAYGMRARHRAQPTPAGPAGAALRDIAIRDALWIAVDARAVTATALLTQLHKALPGPYDAAPMFLFGWASWRAGERHAGLGGGRPGVAFRTPAIPPHNYCLRQCNRGMDPHSTRPCLAGGTDSGPAVSPA